MSSMPMHGETEKKTNTVPISGDRNIVRVMTNQNKDRFNVA